jgi:hypothetical protein
VASPIIEALLKARLERTPLGTNALFIPSEETDATLGPVAVASPRRGSKEHELFHAGMQGRPSTTLLEALVGAASDFGYGGQSAYRNPMERAAYGYQEEVTGEADPSFAQSGDAINVAALPKSHPRMIVRNVLDELGKISEAGGRYLGRREKQ